MNRTLIRRSLLVLAVVLAAALAIVRSPRYSLGLDLRGGASLILRVKVDGLPPRNAAGLSSKRARSWSAASTLTAFLKRTVQPYGSRGNELLVQLPGVSDPSRITNLLQSRAVLEWYSVEDGPYCQRC